MQFQSPKNYYIESHQHINSSEMDVMTVMKGGFIVGLLYLDCICF